MVQLWLILGILSYLSFSISAAIDKYMMNVKFNLIKTFTIKSLFNSIILLIIGILFFNLNFTSNLIFWSAILGIVFGGGGILYYKALQLKDLEVVVPYFHSVSILLIFMLSVIFFNEVVTQFNYLGVFLILIGSYSVLATKRLRIPKLDRGTIFLSLFVISGTIYWLLVKKVLFDVEPINLAITVYFFTVVYLKQKEKTSLYS